METINIMTDSDDNSDEAYTSSWDLVEESTSKLFSNVLRPKMVKK